MYNVGDADIHVWVAKRTMMCERMSTLAGSIHKEHDPELPCSRAQEDGVLHDAFAALEQGHSLVLRQGYSCLDEGRAMWPWTSATTTSPALAFVPRTVPPMVRHVDTHEHIL